MIHLLRYARRLPIWPLLAVAILIPFARLVADPGTLIVDGKRPSVDRATPPDAEAVGNDLTRLFLPHHARVASSVKASGHVPGWDPAGFGGRPMVGNPQAGLWYPPVWIAWRWWTPSALGWLTLAHLFGGSVGVYVLARSQRLSSWASFVAGTLWASSPYVLAQAYEGHYPHVWSASFAPWTFWAAISASRGKTRGWLIPPLLALGGLTGHAQETYYVVLALMIGLGFVALRTKPVLPTLGVVGGFALITCGFLAIEILPDYLARSYVVRPFRPTAVDAARYHVGLLNLKQLLYPFALGGPADYRGPDNYWESLLSVGCTPLILLVAGARRFRRRGAVQGWLALTTLAVLFAFGRYFVVFDVLFAVTPGMTSFRVPSRSLFLAALGVAMLAGHGVQVLRLCGRRHHRALVRVGARAVGLLAIVEMLAYGYALIQVAPASHFLGPDPVGNAILKHRPEGPFRVRARDPFWGDARAFAIGLQKTNLNDSFQIRNAADLYERLYPMFGSPLPARFPERFRPEVQDAVLRRMNVEFTISDRDTPDLGWPLAASGAWDGKPYTIRRNPEPLPRAYVVPQAQIVADGPAVIDRFVDLDPREFVLMEADPLKAGPRQPFTPATYVSADPDRVEIRVSTKAPGLLVVADTWMPGWSATDRGRPVQILRGNRSQRVIALAEPGDHEIVMSYIPPGLALGKGITVASIVLWALGAIVWLLRGRFKAILT